MKTILNIPITFLLIVTLAVLVNLQPVAAQQDAAPQAESVVDVVDANDETTDFGQLLEDSGFADVLQAEGPYTVLAPSNEAIESSGTSMDELKENPQMIKTLVQGHLYQGELPPEQVESMLEVEVQDTDESASNGTVHVVDEVVEKTPANN